MSRGLIRAQSGSATVAPHKSTSITAVTLDQHIELTLVEVCEACGLYTERLIEMVEEGVIEPRGVTPAAWRFDGLALERAQLAARLQRDLDINLAGAALALDLLDELRSLRQRVQRLESELYQP